MTTSTLARPVKPTYAFQPENIPDELRQVDRWVVWGWRWQNGKWDKPPIHPKDGYNVSAHDSANWLTFDKAASYVKARKADGIGFVFSDADDISGTDLDGCIDELGNLGTREEEIIGRLDSYAEQSPSGHGVKVFHRGDFPHDGKKGNVEQYMAGRYFTVTGNHLGWTPKGVYRRPRQLAALNAEIFAPKPDPKPPTTSVPPVPVDLSDLDLIEKAKERNPKFARLWEGDTSDYPSHSEADGALAFYLMWWTNHDLERADRLFRQSGLMRDKWDERHGAQTYGEITLAGADRLVSGGYHGNGDRPTDPPAEVSAMNCNGCALVRDAIARAERAEDRIRQVLRVQRNPHIKGERHTALAVVTEVQSAISRKVDQDGWVKVSRRSIAETSGASEKTVSDHTERLQQWGLLEKNVRNRWTKTVDRETGEIREGWAKELWIRLKGTVGETLDRLATLDPERPEKHPNTWGGKRTPKCPDHPDAKIRLTLVASCSVCGRELDRQEQGDVSPEDTPKLQLVTIENDPEETTLELQKVLVCEDRINKGKSFPSNTYQTETKDTSFFSRLRELTDSGISHWQAIEQIQKGQGDR